MKRLLIILSVIILSSLLILGVFGEEDENNITLSSVLIDGKTRDVSVNIEVSEAFASTNKKIFLFRTGPGFDGNVGALMPIAEADLKGGTVTLSAEFDPDDQISAYYGYLLAVTDSAGKFAPVTEVFYPSNISSLAAHNYEYPSFASKKGLQVQLISDASLLGIGHTVVNAFINELISTNDTNSTEFIFSGNSYYIDNDALNALDYRIKTLSEAGIHVYMNLLLAFDTSAPSELYYPDAESQKNALYAPNVSTPENIKLIAGLVNFLANRYTDPSGAYGFCGSYIIGYEVNSEYNRNNAGISILSTYAYQYSTLLRACDTALKTAYSNSRIFTSVSNLWNVDKALSEGNAFGGAEFLSELSRLCGDIDFGVAINPYPSKLENTACWNDEAAKNDPSTVYLTVKNFSVFADFMNSENMLFNGKVRSALVSEFGISGKRGDKSEREQALSYAYAYYSVCKYDFIESFIWHRHVDHSGEDGLYYGLYTSSELLLDPKSKKMIYNVMHGIDTLDNGKSIIPELFEKEELELLSSAISDDAIKGLITRELISSDDVKFQAPIGVSSLFDFSKSLYGFYPAFNTYYLEQCRAGSLTYMRSALMRIASVEYMGVCANISDASVFDGKDNINLKVRVISGSNTADIITVLSGKSADGKDIDIKCSATISCNEWVNLSFKVSELDRISDGKCKIKILARCDENKDGESFIDIASVSLSGGSSLGIMKISFAVIFCVAAASFVIIYLHYRRKKKASDISKSAESTKE